MLNFQDLCRLTHMYSRRNGFWDHEKITSEPHPESGSFVEVPNPSIIPEKLALIQSEISEALEDWRAGKMKMLYEFKVQPDMTKHLSASREIDGVLGKPVGFPSEMADAVIRIAELCYHLNIDLEKAIEEKMAYNETRPYKHGKKA